MKPAREAKISAEQVDLSGYFLSSQTAIARAGATRKPWGRREPFTCSANELSVKHVVRQMFRSLVNHPPQGRGKC